MSLRRPRQNSAGKPRESGYVDPRVGDKAEGKVGIAGPRYELWAGEAAVCYKRVTGATVPVGCGRWQCPSPKPG